MVDRNNVDGVSSEFFENQWLSTRDLAGMLRVSENAIRIMVHRNQIASYKLGHRLRFRLKDCQALFVKKGT